MTSNRRYRGILCLALWSLSACTAWRAGTSPGDPSAYDEPVIRVYRQDGAPVVLHRPTVVGDSVHGWSAEPGAATAASVAVALRDVRRVERRRTDGPKSAALVVGMAAGALTALVLAAGSYEG